MESNTPLNSLLSQVRNNDAPNSKDSVNVDSSLINKNTTSITELNDAISGNNGLNFNLSQLTDEIVKLNFSLKKNAPVNNTSNNTQNANQNKKHHSKWQDEYTDGNRSVPKYRPTLTDKIKDFSPLKWAAEGTMFEDPLARMREKSKFKRAGGTGSGYEQQQRAAKEFHKIHEHERDLRSMGFKKDEINDYRETSILGESRIRLGDRKKNAKDLLGSAFTGIGKVSSFADKITPDKIVNVDILNKAKKASPLSGDFSLTEEESENYTVQKNILKTLVDIRKCVCEGCGIKGKKGGGSGEGEGFGLEELLKTITGGAAGGTLAKSLTKLVPQIIKGLGPISLAATIALLLKAVDDSGWQPQWVKDLGKFFGVDEAGRKKAEDKAVKGMTPAQQTAFEKEVEERIKAAGPDITQRRKENIRSDVYKKYAQQGVLPKKAPQGPAVDPSNYNPVPGADEDRALIEQIYKMEGTSDEKAQKAGYKSGYDVPLGYGKYGGGPDEKPLSELTMKEVRERQTQILNHPDNKLNSSAVGKPQIVRKTLFGKQNKKTGEWDETTSVAAELGLKDDDIFTPEVQDRITRHLAKRRGLDAYKRGEITEEQFQELLGPEWQSIQLKGLTPELRAAMEQSKKQATIPDPNAATPIPNDPNNPPSDPQNVYDSLKGRTAHNGVDVGNLDADYAQNLNNFITEAEEKFGKKININSGYRPPTNEEKAAIGSNGSTQAGLPKSGRVASTWGSMHGRGSATDLAFEGMSKEDMNKMSPEDKKEWHRLTEKHKLNLALTPEKMANIKKENIEYWHVEPEKIKRGDMGLRGQEYVDKIKSESLNTAVKNAKNKPAAPVPAAAPTAASSEPADPMAPGWEEQFAIDTAGFGTASASGGIDDSNTLTTRMMNTPAKVNREESKVKSLDLDTELAKAEFEEKSNNWKYDDAQRAKKELAKSQAASKPVEEKLNLLVMLLNLLLNGNYLILIKKQNQ